MPKSCVAVGCTNHNMMQKTGLTFHIFPDRIKKKEKWEKWVHAMKRMNEDGSPWFPKSIYVYICSAHFISGRPSNDPLNQDFVPTIFQQKEIDSRKRKHAKIKLAAKTNHQTAQVDDLLSEMLKEQDRDNKMVKEETVDIKVESGTKQADTKNSCLQKQETMASGSSMDTSSHAKPGSLPIYPSSSVTVHVPYTSNHGQVSSPTIQHRQTAPGIKVGQTTAVIQKASPAPLPNRSVPLQTYQSKYGELLNVIEDLGREIKPTYAGSKMAQERLKKGIMHARTLVRECLLEVDKSSRQ